MIQIECKILIKMIQIECKILIKKLWKNCTSKKFDIFFDYSLKNSNRLLSILHEL